jgi:hypothetical protein
MGRLLPMDFPVQLVELALTDDTGYTLRCYVTDGVGQPRAAYLTESGRLPLFRRPERAAGFAAATARHGLTEVFGWPHWAATLRTGLLPLHENHRYAVDLASLNLGREPDLWLRPLLIRSVQAVRELIRALALPDGEALFQPGGLLDQFDELVRLAEYGPHRRWARRQLSTLDRSELIRQWRYAVSLVEERIDWRD